MDQYGYQVKFLINNEKFEARPINNNGRKMISTTPEQL